MSALSSTVSLGSFAAMGATLLLTLVLPIIIAIIVSVKHKGMASAIIVGALGFYVPQMVIRIPILQLLGTTPQFLQFASENTALYSLILGLSAAVFETVGRLLVFYFMRKKLSFQFGLGAGFGHGAMEAISIVGLTYINNIIIAIILNLQGVQGLSALLGGEEIALNIAGIFEQTAPYVYLVAGLERLFAIAFHIAMSLLICYGFMVKKTALCAVLVITWHTAIDAIIVFIGTLGANILIIEIFVGLNAAAAIALILWLKKRFPLKNMPQDDAQKAVDEGY